MLDYFFSKHTQVQSYEKVIVTLIPYNFVNIRDR